MYTVEGRLVGLLGVNAPSAFNAMTRSLLVAPRAVPHARPGYRRLAAVG
jgi:hypothetical protein